MKAEMKESSLRHSTFPVRCSAVFLPLLLASGCTKMITVPIKTAGKVTITSIQVAGDVTVAGAKAGTKVAQSAGGDSNAAKAAMLLAK
jgi:hypothetical protein